MCECDAMLDHTGRRKAQVAQATARVLRGGRGGGPRPRPRAGALPGRNFKMRRCVAARLLRVLAGSVAAASFLDARPLALQTAVAPAPDGSGPREAVDGTRRSPPTAEASRIAATRLVPTGSSAGRGSALLRRAASMSLGFANLDLDGDARNVDLEVHAPRTRSYDLFGARARSISPDLAPNAAIYLPGCVEQCGPCVSLSAGVHRRHA